MFRSFVVLLVALIGSTFAKAQDTLSLARAIQIGLKNNFDVQIGYLNQEIAANNNSWRQAGAMPVISFNTNQNNSIVQRKPANPFAVAGRNISDNVTGQLDAQFTLFDGFSVRLNKQRLEQLEKLSYGNTAFVLENTVQAIILGYYQALLEKERLQVLRITQVLSKERYDYVKLRKELGGAISFDVLQEQNNYLTDSANVLLQEINYKNSLRDLNLLLNNELTVQYELIDSLHHTAETYAYNDLKNKMVSSNTNLQNQFVNQEILRNTLLQNRSNMAPTLNLNMGANGSLDRLNANFRTPTGNRIENTVGYLNRDRNFPVYQEVNETALTPLTQTGNSYGAYANFTLRFNISNGGQVRRAIENAQISEKIGQLTTEQLKRSLENDLMANYDLYNLRRQLVSIAETKLQAAQLNLSLANERYKNGALSAIDLRIVQENFRNAALENYLAIYNSIASRVSLVRLTGGLIDKQKIQQKD